MSLLKDQIEIEIQEAELIAQKNLAEFPPFMRWLFIIGVILIIPAYFIAKNVAAKIYVEKYAAVQVTAKPSFTDPKAPTFTNVYLTTLGTSQYAAAVLITNPNLDLSFKETAYQFTFLNSAKQIVHTNTGKVFLLPNEKKYIVVPTFTANDKITFANFELTEPVVWQKRLNITKVEITTSIPQTYFELSPPTFVVEGNFYNNSAYQLKQVNLTFILYDKTGTIVAASYRNESTVNPFERRTYKQLWPNMNGDNIARVEVFSSTNVLDPSNLKIQSYQPGDLSRPDTR